MATKTIGPPRLVKPDAANREVIDDSYRVLNGQTWSAGDFLFLDASGLLKKCADDQDAALGGIKFFALEDQSDPGNSTTKGGAVIPITREMEFEVNVHHGTAASALAAASIIGLQYNMIYADPDGTASGDHVVLDLSDTGDPAFDVVAIASDYAPENNTVADVYGLCRVKITSANLDATPA